MACRRAWRVIGVCKQTKGGLLPAMQIMMALRLDHHDLLERSGMTLFIIQPLWPSRARVQQHMPAVFRVAYPNVRVILHCTELKVQ